MSMVDMEEPKSPDHKAYIDNYTPSKEPQDVQDFFGRRRLRIMNGQDPVHDAEKFTPRINPRKFKWPTNEEAKIWAAEVFGKSGSNTKSKKQKLFVPPSVGTVKQVEGSNGQEVEAVPMKPFD